MTRWAIRLAQFTITSLILTLLSASAFAQQADYNGIDVMFVVDQSGSMSGAYGQTPTDPNMLRFESMQFIVDWLGDFAHYAEPSSTIRMSVIYFGDPQRTLIQDWVQLSPPGSSDQDWDIQSTDLRRLLSPAQFGFPPRHFDFTNFEGAMRLAREQFDLLQPPPNNQSNLRLIVIITDGAPCTLNDLDENNNCNNPSGQRGQLDRVNQLAQQAFSAPEYRLFVLALDNVADSRNFWETYRAQWEQIVGDTSRAQMIGNVNEMIRAVLDFMAQIRPLVSNSQSTSSVEIDANGHGIVEMPPYVRKARFNVFKVANSNTPFDMTITMPDGVQVTRTSPQTEVSSDFSNVEVWSFNLPVPGTWSLQTNTPGADVEVELDQVFFKGELIDLTSISRYQWQMIPLASFLYYLEDGITQLPVTLNPNYPITLTTIITTPSGNQLQVMLDENTTDPPGGNRRPQFRGAFVPSEVGEYTIEMVGQVLNVPDPLGFGGAYTPLDTRTANDRIQFRINPVDVALEISDVSFLQNDGNWHLTRPLPLCVIVKDRVTGARIPNLDLLQFDAELQRPDSSRQIANLIYQPDLAQHCTFTGNIAADTVGLQPLIIRGYLPDEQGGRQQVYERQADLPVNVLPVQYIRLVVEEPADAVTSSPSISTMPFFGSNPMTLIVEARNQQGERIDLRTAVGGVASPDPNPLILRIQQLEGSELVDVTGSNLLTTVDGTTFRLNTTEFGVGSYQVSVEGKPLLMTECDCAYEPINTGNDGSRVERTIDRYFPFEVLLWPVGVLVLLAVVSLLIFGVYRWGQDRSKNAMRGMLYFTLVTTNDMSEVYEDPTPILVKLDEYKLNKVELSKRQLRGLGLPFRRMLMTNHGSERNHQQGVVFLTIEYADGRKDRDFAVTAGAGQYDLPNSRQPDGSYYMVENDAEASSDGYDGSSSVL